VYMIANVMTAAIAHNNKKPKRGVVGSDIYTSTEENIYTVAHTKIPTAITDTTTQTQPRQQSCISYSSRAVGDSRVRYERGALWRTQVLCPSSFHWQGAFYEILVRPSLTRGFTVS